MLLSLKLWALESFSRGIFAFINPKLFLCPFRKPFNRLFGAWHFLLLIRIPHVCIRAKNSKTFLKINSALENICPSSRCLSLQATQFARTITWTLIWQEPLEFLSNVAVGSFREIKKYLVERFRRLSRAAPKTNRQLLPKEIALFFGIIYELLLQY